MTTTDLQQPSPAVEQPTKEHQWLQQLVGEWTHEIEGITEPDRPLEKSTGTESVKSLGDLWVVAEGQGEMCGTMATTIMTLGYNPQKQRFVGTWVGSIMPHLWVYDGELDAAERVLTLHSEGPAMNGEAEMSQYKDVIEFKHPDHRVLTSFYLTSDGEWQQFMTANYHRQLLKPQA
ncbi:DUF1579 domain-containing protein [Nodosilinea sp. LEGE 06152]|uniref:DUF1579 domain-containing protein n=1 Tax=Nodosilinea sp. LEGE 06152 TaxID=2777966 RepID=UPI00187E096D|nr:DUF1579 domain-containing protein [Nodosilinea sp. LEGE 06152]MBE9159553.1 DUF1579 domain-containing protein [Nodosilinea sp. LEGE 06152]